MPISIPPSPQEGRVRHQDQTNRERNVKTEGARESITKSRGQ